MRKIMSGEWASSIVTTSAREGLFAPAFCAFIVRRVRLVVGGAALGDSACLSKSCVTCVGTGYSGLGRAVSEAIVGTIPCGVAIL